MNVAVRVSVAAVGMVLALLAGPAAVRAGNVPCEQVIAKSNELARKGSEKKGDVIYIGRRLGTSPLWVERCFQAHGRRVTRHAQRGSEEPEDLLERWEEAEREEPARNRGRQQREDLLGAGLQEFGDVHDVSRPRPRLGVHAG